MNKQIRLVGVVAAVMVFALLANLTYLNLGQQDSLEANVYNLRAREAEFDFHRGQILAGNTVIADSVIATDGDYYKYQRVYANGPLYAPITGYYSYRLATSRIENSYNSYLVGSDSSQWLQHLIDLTSGKVPQGATVVTTISPALQEAAANALAGYTGAVVALDPHSGAVRALVTSPSYDPNVLASHDLTTVDRAWDQLLEDPTEPMADRASYEIHAPGSTFKLVVAAAALEEGYAPDSMIDAPDEIDLPGSTRSLPNAVPCGDGEVTLTRALQLSCNTAFAGLGYELGDDALRDQAERFGFNSAHLPDLGGSASVFPEQMDGAQLMLSSIGQWDVSASPLQMAMVASAFVNNGMLAEPYIVEEVRAPDLSVLYRHEVEQTLAVTPRTAQEMEEMMIAVVEDGLGTPAQIPGVTVGGKSGTAENDPSSPNYAWFVAFALNPDVVVCVFLQRSDFTSDDLWGSGDAAPVTRAVLEATR